MKRMSLLIRSEEGQGMTEYIIIVALIAIAAIAVITLYGQQLRALFAASSNAMGGQEYNANVAASGGGYKRAGAERKGVSNFGTNNFQNE
ncbi:MAG TPA: hypothetical protein VGK67_05445 [Myxococcales bacterium]|jgi:Flp pilus assembly pilin Flp